MEPNLTPYYTLLYTSLPARVTGAINLIETYRMSSFKERLITILSSVTQQVQQQRPSRARPSGRYEIPNRTRVGSRCSGSSPNDVTSYTITILISIIIIIILLSGGGFTRTYCA